MNKVIFLISAITGLLLISGFGKTRNSETSLVNKEPRVALQVKDEAMEALSRYAKENRGARHRVRR